MTTSHPTFPPFSIDDARAQVAVELLTYGEDPDQIVEIYGNRSASDKTIVLIHGGYWRNIFDREHLRPLGVELAKAGHHIAIPEFRRIAGEPDLTISDLSLALQSLGARKLILIGYSSGGHLALIVADNFPNVSKVIGLAPVTDLVESQIRELGRGAVLEWLGCDASERADLDPMARPPIAAETIFIHGDQDERVPLEITESYIRQMESRGQEIELNILAGVSHFQMMELPSSTFEAILTVIN